MISCCNVRRSANVPRRFICDDSYLAGAVKSMDETAKFSQELQAEIASFSSLKYASADNTVQPALGQWDRAVPVSPADQVAKNLLVPALQITNWRGLLVAATAAALILILVWQNLSLKSEFERLHSLAARPNQSENDQSHDSARRRAADAVTSTVARVTGLVNCGWPAGTTPLKFGDTLAPGQRLKLEKGLMQVTFGTGAQGCP